MQASTTAETRACGVDKPATEADDALSDVSNSSVGRCERQSSESEIDVEGFSPQASAAAVADASEFEPAAFNGLVDSIKLAQSQREVVDQLLTTAAATEQEVAYCQQQQQQQQQLQPQQQQQVNLLSTFPSQHSLHTMGGKMAQFGPPSQFLPMQQQHQQLNMPMASLGLLHVDPATRGFNTVAPTTVSLVGSNVVKVSLQQLDFAGAAPLLSHLVQHQHHQQQQTEQYQNQEQQHHQQQQRQFLQHQQHFMQQHPQLQLQQQLLQQQHQQQHHQPQLMSFSRLGLLDMTGGNCWQQQQQILQQNQQQQLLSDSAAVAAAAAAAQHFQQPAVLSAAAKRPSSAASSTSTESEGGVEESSDNPPVAKKSRKSDVDANGANDLEEIHRFQRIAPELFAWNGQKPMIHLFLLKLLDNPKCCDSIEWVNKEARLFKVISPSTIAKLWKHIKGNKTDNYECFARGIRHSRDIGHYFEPHDFRKKKIYKFSAKAMDDLIQAKHETQATTDEASISAVEESAIGQTGVRANAGVLERLKNKIVERRQSTESNGEDAKISAACALASMATASDKDSELEDKGRIKAEENVKLEETVEEVKVEEVSSVDLPEGAD